MIKSDFSFNSLVVKPHGLVILTMAVMQMMFFAFAAYQFYLHIAKEHICEDVFEDCDCSTPVSAPLDFAAKYIDIPNMMKSFFEGKICTSCSCGNVCYTLDSGMIRPLLAKAFAKFTFQ